MEVDAAEVAVDDPAGFPAARVEALVVEALVVEAALVVDAPAAVVEAAAEVAGSSPPVLPPTNLATAGPARGHEVGFSQISP